MDKEIQEQITQYRMTSEAMGDAAREAMRRGDIGLARTAARQAAQHARMVLQLETGERMVEPEDVAGDAISDGRAEQDSAGESINV